MPSIEINGQVTEYVFIAWNLCSSLFLKRGKKLGLYQLIQHATSHGSINR